MKGWITFLQAEWDRVLGWTLVAGGIVAVVAGFSGVADSALVADQLAYIASGGIGGLLLCGLGVGLLVSADLHDEWRKLDRIETVLADRSAEIPVSAAPSPEATPRPETERPGSPGPAFRPDHVATPAGFGAGFLVLAGWHHAAGTAHFDGAVGGTGVSTAGLLLGLTGVAATLVMRRSRLASRKRYLLGGFLLADLVAQRRPQSRRTPSSDPGGNLNVVEGGRRFHRPGCPASTSLPTRMLPPGAAHQLEPCGICRPDGPQPQGPGS